MWLLRLHFWSFFEQQSQNDLCLAHLRCTEQQPMQESWGQKEVKASGNCCPLRRDWELLPWGKMYLWPKGGRPHADTVPKWLEILTTWSLLWLGVLDKHLRMLVSGTAASPKHLHKDHRDILSKKEHGGWTQAKIPYLWYTGHLGTVIFIHRRCKCFPTNQLLGLPL